MAYNYIVPQLRVFQEFAASEVTDTTSMRACIVAPKYITLDGTLPTAYVGAYTGASFNADYPGLPAGSLVTDLTTVRVFVRNAYIARTAPAFETATGNAATFAGAVTGDVATGDHAFKVGDRLIADAVAYTVIGFGGTAPDANNIVYVNTTIASSGSVQLLSLEDVEVTEIAGVVATSTAITLPAALAVVAGETVKTGDIYVALSAFDPSLAGTTGNISSLTDIEDILGEATPANPLAMMAKIALQNSNGTGISYIALATDSDAGYAAAFDLLDGDFLSYSIVPYSQSAAVRTSLVAKINELANATNMNWKIGWLGYDPAALATVVDADREGDAISLTLGNPSTSLVLDNVDLSLVNVGDTVNLSNTDGVTTAVVSVVSSTTNTLTVKNSVAADTYAVTITRSATASSKAVETSAVSAALDNMRIRLVCGDGPVLTEFPDQPVSSAYLAAAAAGLRSASAPHQPITRVTLTGVTLSNASGFTGSHFNTMASNGVWIVARDNGTSVVYNRHQLTTCWSEARKREDSKITNADEISRYYREALDDLYGRANISDELTETLYLRLGTIYQVISSRTWSWQLGKQITDVLTTSIERDPDLSNRLIVRVSLSTPDPLNNLDIYLTIA